MADERVAFKHLADLGYALARHVLVATDNEDKLLRLPMHGDIEVRVADPPDRDKPVDKGGLAGAARCLDIYLFPIITGLYRVQYFNMEIHYLVYATADTRDVEPDE